MGALAFLAAFAIVILGVWALQRQLIYFPDSRVPSIAAMGSGWAEVSYETADGLTLAAWYRPPEPSQPTVIVLHGNGGNRGGRAPLGRALAAAGLGVLLTDYRGYGGNPGHPTEDGLARDARAAVAYLEEQGPGIPLVYFGGSLGAAVAVELATEHAPAALVLRSPFTSLVAVGRYHYPWLPVSALLKDRYESDELVATIDVPTLVIAGDRDSTVPVEQSRSIYDGLPGPKRLLIVPGADHNSAALLSGDEMIGEIIDFIVTANDSGA